MKFEILTIFPKIFTSFKNEALVARAQKKKIISINVHNLRGWTSDARRTVDLRPYGGGAGMVMMVEPIMKAVESLKLKAKSIKQKTRVILFSAKGKKFDQTLARKYAKNYKQLIMICGRYEGVDERVAKYIADEEISIGDYVLFGGEAPAMVVMEAVTRLLPSALGKQKSLEDESFKEANLLEYPHYTRPEVITINGKRRRVPKVLLGGDHKKIGNWQQEQSYKITKKRRPDLIGNLKIKNQDARLPSRALYNN